MTMNGAEDDQVDNAYASAPLFLSLQTNITAFALDRLDNSGMFKHYGRIAHVRRKIGKGISD